MQITFIRHSSLAIAPNICYGQSDVDVSQHFADELCQLQAKLQDTKFDVVYTSPLQRCYKLAQALCAGADLGVTTQDINLDVRLKELNFGDWELKPWDAIPREIFDFWASDYANIAPPMGETLIELHARCQDFIEDLILQAKGKKIMVVTHGGVIRAMLAQVLNMPLKGLFRIHIDYIGITQISYQDAVPKIHFVNR